MKLRRCASLQVELDQEPRFEFTALFDGGDGLERSARWMATAAHLTQACEVSLEQLALLAQVPCGEASERPLLEARHGAAAVRELVEAGLLLPEGDDGDPALVRDRNAREVPWWPPALAAQVAGAWESVDIEAREEAGLMPSSAELVAANGPAPAHEHWCRPGAPTQALPPPERREFDRLLAQRRTCRNFDPGAVLEAGQLATMLHRVWGALGTRELAPGAVAVKKTSPAGGGLHAVEAYLLVQRVQGLAPGLYHYLPLRHALEPLRIMDAADTGALAHRFLAGQRWFHDCPVLVVMTARFDRLFWKYRRHPKAWRVLHLDAGHLSQTMYLSAADLGLGAFVTAAINDRDIEQALGLAPLREGALAIVGFGARTDAGRHVELDGLQPTPAAVSGAV